MALQRVARLGLIWLATLFGTSATAVAEPRIAVSPPASFVAGDPSLVVQSPGARGNQLLRAMLVVDYVRAPLVLVAQNQDAHAVVEEQLWLHAAAAFALHHRWLVALDVPFLLREQGEGTPFTTGLAPVSGQTALGDPHVTLRGRVLGDADGFALGLGARASIPLATTAYAGSPGLVLGPFVSAGHQTSSVFSAFALGFEWREAQTLPGVLPTRIGSSVQLGLAGGFMLDAAGTTRLGPELAFNSTVGNGASLLDPRSTVCELLLHLQHRLLGGPFEVGAAFGPSLGRAPGAAEYRALLSLVFSPEEPLPPPDGDDDRVPDDSDMCPSIAGESSEDPMMHGCPPVPSDADGDGIPDTMDACPRTAGEPSVNKKRHGCPKPQDRDQDTIADPDDACPDEPGLENGDPQRRGCPQAKPTVTLEQAAITISEQVQFETGTAVIRDDSAGLLQQVVEVLRAHPEIESCEVAGHTDNTGTPELNLALSEARARAVMNWLVTHGTEPERLTAKGYGEARPLADNATEEGRAQNRRVELLIVRRSAPERQP